MDAAVDMADFSRFEAMSNEQLMVEIKAQLQINQRLRDQLKAKRKYAQSLLNALHACPFLFVMLSYDLLPINCNGMATSILGTPPFPAGTPRRAALESALAGTTRDAPAARFTDTLTLAETSIPISWTACCSFLPRGGLARVMLHGLADTGAAARDWEREFVKRPPALDIYSTMDQFDAEGFWVCNFADGAWSICFASSAVEQLWGVPAAELYADATLWWTQVDPRDREDAHAAFHEFAKGDTPSLDAQYRVIARDTGKVRHVRTNGTKWVDSAGVIQSAFGSVSDVTDEIRREKEAKDVTAMMQHLTNELVDELVWVNNLRDSANFIGQYLSSALERWTGISAQEFRDDPTKYLQALIPEQRDWAVRRFLSSTHTVRFHNLRTGELVVTKTHSVLLRNAQGRPVASVGISRDVTQITRVLDELTRVDTMFRQLDRDTVSTLWIRDKGVSDGRDTEPCGSNSGRLVYISQSCEKLFGYTAEQLLASPSQEDGLALQQAFGEFNAPVADVSEHAKGLSVRKLVRPDGKVKYGLFQRKAVINNRGQLTRVAGTVSDVTDIVERQNMLADYRGKLEAIMDNIETYVLVIDVISSSTRRVIFANKYFEILTGYKRHRIKSDINFWFNTVIHPDDREEVRQGFLEFVAAREGPARDRNIGYRIVTADGAVKNVIAMLNKAEHGEGGEFYVAGMVYDVTDMTKSLVDKALIEQQAHQAQRTEMLGVLSGGIASDFTLILGVITRNAEQILSETESEAEAHADLRQLLREVIQSTTAIRAVTDKLRSYAGKGEVTMACDSLTAMLRRLLPFLDAPANVAVTWELADEATLPLVRADEVQLGQVVQNLFANSVDAIGSSSGTIVISTGAMPTDEGPAAFVRVADTGCGMDAAVMDRLFEPMFSTKFTGRGLGMAAVKGIVDTHGGSIDVESEVGAGTTFTVLFPACRDCQLEGSCDSPLKR
ncbi:Histidine kinase- DNA gyrase B- and HSP90-like ATPase [Carpediemonas membranifera]|uniref:histidine kinase n=1 Tax=Carpediemonas membranifera TaxID=201153 RepID=A0A8J6B372_9EUKA|nr:Histidine kinase- DNA gyrase B- and HSP90-like ATPase [Carpediemonas membranifera]|eukprot:KAG9393319.1 Histidine kinase- DNA gyrase B- and HSP90-like ATPase [Carpediemonas membranifera]